jgi:hypothetical protein
MLEAESTDEIRTRRPVCDLCEHGYVINRRFFAGEVEYVLVPCPSRGVCGQGIANDA